VIQVGGRPGTGQADRFVSGVHVWTIGIILGVNRERAESQFGCGANDPECDLTAIRDQQARHIRSFVGFHQIPSGSHHAATVFCHFHRIITSKAANAAHITSIVIACGDVKE
jgi:hypothetical protein